MKPNRKLAIFFSFLMVVAALSGIVLSTNSFASSPPSSIANTAYINVTMSGFTTQSAPSGSVTLSATQGGSQSIYEDISTATSWTTSGSNAVISFTAGNYPIYAVSSGTVFFNPSFQFQAGVEGAGFYNVGTVNTTLTLTPDGSGSSYSQTQSYTFNAEWTGSNDWVEVSPAFTGSVSAGYYTMSFSFTVSPDSGYNFDSGNPAGLTTVSDSTAGNYANNPELSVANTYYGFYEYTYSGVNAIASWSNPSNLQAFNFTWSTSISGTSSSIGSGYYYSSFPTSATFTQSGTPTVPSYSVNWNLNTEVLSETTTVSNTTGVQQNPTENQNWWNSTISASFTPPSTWINGASVDNKNWNTVVSSYTVQHVLSVGSGTSPGVDILSYSGSSSGSFTDPSKYPSWSASPSSVENSGFSLSWSISEFINYYPVTPTLSVSFSGSGSQANLNIVTSEKISGEKENIQINWGDGTITNLNDVSFGTQPVQSHSYSGTYQGTFSQSYTIIVTVTNIPNGNPSGNAQLSSSNSIVYTFGMTDNPTIPDSILKVGQSIYMNITTTNLAISGATVSVNGLSPSSATLVYQKGSVYDFKYSSSLFGV